eukprot:gb/GECG01008407.1/.p1 GENE.gb/GECG01008407.1/~~gb/GECG01008407.1/.p1  ORF type:complete len:1702 (+),score=231.44 gb/GECG01008407.1/:1-5106(+)
MSGAWEDQGAASREQREEQNSSFLEDEASLSAELHISGNRLKDRVKCVVFRLLKLMTENQKVTTLSKITEVILLVIDWLQVVQLLVAPDFGWHEDSFQWVGKVSILRLLLPGQNATSFNIAYGISLVITWMSLLDAFYVSWELMTSNYKSIWPLKALRALVTTVLTAGFIPIMEVLAIPFGCGGMKEFFGDIDCNGFPHVLYIVSSVITLVAFVPFALLMSLVYFDDNQLSGSPTAKPIGRLDYYDTLMRTCLTLIVVLLRNRGVLLSLITLGMMVYLVLFTNITFPYFKLWMNRMRSAFYLILVWISFGALIASAADLSEDALREYSISWISLSILVGIAGIYTPMFRYRWLRKVSWKVGNQLRYDEEMRRLGITGAASRILSPHELYEKRRKFGGSRYKITSSTMTDLLSPPSKSEIHQNDEITATKKPDRPRKNAKALDDLLEAEQEEEIDGVVAEEEDKEEDEEGTKTEKLPLAEVIKKYYIFEYDIELMVRILLEDPTRENFKQATVILNAALTSFPESVFVRVIYAFLILTYSNSSSRAVALLKESQKLPAPLDLKFLVFSKIHAWNQIRQDEVMGTGKDMVSAIQFKKKMEEASSEHIEAIRGIKKFWELLRNQEDDEKSSIAAIIGRIADARDKAKEAYTDLLDEYPSSRRAMYRYGLFCLYVLNDEHKADLYLSKVQREFSQNQDVTGSVQGGDRGSTLGSSVAGSMAARSPKAQQLQVKCEEFDALKKIKMSYRSGMVLLVSLTIATFVTSVIFIDKFFKTNESLSYAGDLRRSIQDASFWSRNMHIAAFDYRRVKYEEGQKGLTESEEVFADSHEHLFRHGFENKNIRKLWSMPSIPMQFFEPSEPNNARIEGRGLWDIGNLYAAAMGTLARFDLERMRSPGDEPLWRIIADNTYSAVLESYERLADMYDTSSQNMAALSVLIQGILLGAKILGIVILGLAVFRPGIHAIAKARMGLHGIVNRIPYRIVKFFHKKYRAIADIYNNIERSDEETADMLEKKLESEELRDNSKVYSTKRSSNLWNNVRTVPLQSLKERNNSQLEESAVFGHKQRNADSSEVDNKAHYVNNESPKKTVASSPSVVNPKAVDRLREEDQRNYDSLLKQHDPEEDITHSVDEHQIGMDAEHDVQLSYAMRQANETIQRELHDKSVAKEFPESYGPDGVLREEVKPGVQIPKLCDHNLRLHDKLMGIPKTTGCEEHSAVATDQGTKPEVAEDEQDQEDKTAQEDGAGFLLPSQLNMSPDSGNHAVESKQLRLSAVNRKYMTDGGARGEKEGTNGYDPSEESSPEHADAASEKEPGVNSKEQSGDSKPLVTSDSTSSSTTQSNSGGEAKEDLANGKKLGNANVQPSPPNNRWVKADASPNHVRRDDEVQRSTSQGFPARSVSSSQIGSQNLNLLLLLFRGHGGHEDDKRIWTLVVQLCFGVLVMAGLFSSSFVMRAQLMRGGATTASVINFGSRRVHVSTEITILARELLINDGEFFPSFNDTRDRLLERIDYLRLIHNSLRFGNPELNLPGGALASTSDDFRAQGKNESDDPYGNAFFPRGIDVGIEFLENSAKLIIDQYDGRMHLPGPNRTALEQVSLIHKMVRLDRNYIRPALLDSSRQLFNSGISSLESLELYEGLLFLCDLSVYLILYLTIYRTIVKQLRSEGRRREDMLSLIPRSVVEHTKSLHVFFQRGGGKDGGMVRGR